MKITKGQLLAILDGIEPDPQLLAKIVIECMKKLPDAYSWQLAQQLYLEYFWDGPVITLTNNITHIVRKFTGTEDIVIYLKELGYSCSANGVRLAIKNRSKNYCNHTFDRDNEKEITFVE